MEELSSDDLAYGTTRKLLTFQGSGIGEDGYYNLQTIEGSGVMSMNADGGEVEEEADCEELEEALDACLNEKNALEQEIAGLEQDVTDLEQEIVELEDATQGLNGCSPIFFNDNIYNTVSGNVCVSSREDGKIDIIWSLTSSSIPAPGGGAAGQYNFQGNIKKSNGDFVGNVNSTNGPYCPYQWQQDQTFTKSASGTGVSGNIISPLASYIDWFVTGNPAAGRSYL